MSGQVSVRRGFSLIEVLIAVLVLSLGLLGLAAVFPVVIAQQRDAVDRTRGAVVAETVRSLLENAENMVSFDGLRRDVWFSAEDELVCGSGFDLDPPNMSFLWEPVWYWSGAPAGHWKRTLENEQQQLVDPSAAMFAFGTVMVGFGQTVTLSCSVEWPRFGEQFDIPVTARLFPQPYSGEQPQYVWDMVPRRTRTGGDGTGLELAVFIRRIDPGIRVPRGFTLSDVLTGNRVPISQARLPVGWDAVTNRPTGNGAAVDGTGVYAVPQTLDVTVRATAPNVLELVSGSSLERQIWSSLVAVPGQIVVDNLGHVLNVVRVPELGANEYKVEVDRVYPASESDFNENVDPRGVKVEQVLFTPQKPVRVFTYRADW